MTAELIDGRKIAHRLTETLRAEVAELGGRPCGLVTIRVGDDPAARLYQRRLQRLAGRVGTTCRAIVLDAAVDQSALVERVRRAGDDPAISGVLLLRPLPPGIDEAAVFAALDPVADIEAVHPENAGLLALGTPRYVPSTAAAVFHVLDHWLDETGQDRTAFYHRSRIVVVGRSNNVGKPLVSLAYARRAAVTSIDEYSARHHQLGSHTRRADVLVVAAGVPGLIRAEHVRAGAVVLDVGINLEPGTGRIVGDVDTEQVRARARALTPVPGGIGPVTDVWLLRNTVAAARLRS